MRRADFFLIFLIALLLIAACARIEKKVTAPEVTEEAETAVAPEVTEEAETAALEGELNAMVADIDNVDKELDLGQDFSQEIALG